MAQNDTNKNGNGGNLGFEADMFKAADKLRTSCAATWSQATTSTSRSG